MADANQTWKKLDVVWKHSNPPARKKLYIYNAVIKQKLLYGLNTAKLTKAMRTPLNDFQKKKTSDEF